MAYGKGGNRTMQKRMTRLGVVVPTADMAALRLKCLSALREFADAVWPDDVLTPPSSGRDVDAAMLAVQSRLSKEGLNNVWAEKMRLSAKAAVEEQRKRATSSWRASPPAARRSRCGSDWSAR